MEKNVRKGGERREEKKQTEERVKELERWREREDRERRKRNVVVKGVEVKEKGIEAAVRRIWEKMEIKAKIKEIKEIGKGNKKERKMALVIMEEKGGKGR